MSVSKENFVKTIFQLKQDARVPPVPGRLASELEISSAAVTDMGHKLSKKGLVIHKKYAPFDLTTEGKALAINIIRKHRLWEFFLHNILELPMEHLHDEAEKLEHQTSDYLAGELERFLNYPKFDPHGDPIPDTRGKFPQRTNEIQLSEAGAGQNYFITRVNVKNAEIMAYLEEEGITLNKRIRIKKYLKAEESLLIEVQGKKLLLPAAIYGSIFVHPEQ